MISAGFTADENDFEAAAVVEREVGFVTGFDSAIGQLLTRTAGYSAWLRDAADGLIGSS
jgi:hypothetical protein